MFQTTNQYVIYCTMNPWITPLIASPGRNFASVTTPSHFSRLIGDTQKNMIEYSIPNSNEFPLFSLLKCLQYLGAAYPIFRHKPIGSLLDSFTHVVYFTMNIANKMPADPFSLIVQIHSKTLLQYWTILYLIILGPFQLNMIAGRDSNLPSGKPTWRAIDVIFLSKPPLNCSGFRSLPWFDDTRRYEYQHCYPNIPMIIH